MKKNCLLAFRANGTDNNSGEHLDAPGWFGLRRDSPEYDMPRNLLQGGRIQFRASVVRDRTAH